MRRILPAVGLFFIAPLVAEFLLGDLPITMLGSLIVLAPAYGGAALLIREIVRRTGRSWPSIMVFALAYGILEEAFMSETLFNPNYLGLNMHLLGPAYIPALGIGAWWTVFVLTLHTVWSISVSIALAEALVPDRATTPWLGRLGLIVVSVLFALAAVALTRFSIKQDHNHFVASVPQFTCSAIIFIAIAAVAFLLPRPSKKLAIGGVPGPWLIGAAALLAGSIFLVVPGTWGWWAVGAYFALDLLMIAAILFWSGRTGWDGRHRLALAGGAALAYAWHAFIQNPAAGKAGTMNRIGNVVFALGLVALLFVAARKTIAFTVDSQSRSTSPT
ncbi:MAG: hypothetical protein ACLQBU_12375 [Terriglobales bacterium]